MKKNKNPIAVAFGSLAIKNRSKKDIKERIRKAGNISFQLREKLGYGYWKDPELVKKAEKLKMLWKKQEQM